MQGLGGCGVFIAPSNELFHAFFKLAPRQENAVVAGGANYANIRAEADDFPLITTARMWLP